MNSETAFTLLADPERKRIVREMVEEGGHATVPNLADSIAARGTSPDAERATVRLIHQHLPMLREQDVVEFDPRGGDVALTDAGAKLAQVVRFAASFDAEGDNATLPNW